MAGDCCVFKKQTFNAFSQRKLRFQILPEQCGLGLNVMSSSYFPLSKASPDPSSLCSAVVPLVPMIFMSTFASVPAPSELPVVTFKEYSKTIDKD